MIFVLKKFLFKKCFTFLIRTMCRWTQKLLTIFLLKHLIYLKLK